MADQQDAAMPSMLSEEFFLRQHEAFQQLALTSCDFVGDSGCTDPDCWRCHSGIGPHNLRTLAGNLAIAAMLCRAHRNATGGEDPPSARPWTPGCGSEAP